MQYSFLLSTAICAFNLTSAFASTTFTIVLYGHRFNLPFDLRHFLPLSHPNFLFYSSLMTVITFISTLNNELANKLHGTFAGLFNIVGFYRIRADDLISLFVIGGERNGFSLFHLSKWADTVSES